MCFLTLSVLGGALGIGSVSLASVGSAVGAGAAAAPWVGLGVVAAETIGTGLSLAGGVASTVSGMQQAEQQAALAEYQASVAEENAKMANRAAMDNDLQANQKRIALMEQMQQTQGNMRADFAGRGVVLGQGTPNDYEADLADAYDMDRRNLEYDVATKSWQYKVEAHNQNEQAKLYRAQADAARGSIPGLFATGALNTAGNLLNSLGNGMSLYAGLGLGKSGADAAASAAGASADLAPMNNAWAYGTKSHGLTQQQPLFGAGVTRNDWWADPRATMFATKKFGGK